MRSTKLAIVKTSAKAGYVRSLHVFEIRDDGWVRGDFSTEVDSWHIGTWFSPQNVISIIDKISYHDYNGIEPGTLVAVGDFGFVGIVTQRKGSQYVILDPTTGKDRLYSWEKVRPLQQNIA
jgi:hypothetical protein